MIPTFESAEYMSIDRERRFNRSVKKRFVTYLIVSLILLFGYLLFFRSKRIATIRRPDSNKEVKDKPELERNLINNYHGHEHESIKVENTEKSNIHGDLPSRMEIKNQAGKQDLPVSSSATKKPKKIVSIGEEWKSIESNDLIPTGCEITMDFKTGKKKARLLKS